MQLLIQILRWIAVLPGSLLAGILALFPLHWLLYFVFTNFVEVYPEMPERILGPAVLSGVFVWVGSRISPAYKFETSVVLFGLWMFVVGGFVFLTFGGREWFGSELFFRAGGLPTIMAIVGAIVGLLVARSEQTLLDEKQITPQPRTS